MSNRDQTRAWIEGLALAASFVPIPQVKYTALVIGTIANAFLQGRPRNDIPNSPAYSWDSAQNQTAQRMLAMPILYGKTRVKPTIKNRFVTIEGDKQYLYLLLSLTGHKIDERVVLNWAPGLYSGGVEVQPPGFGAFPSEPGRTYISMWNALTLQSDPYTNSDKWKVGPGTAAVTDILINNNPIANYFQVNELIYETRPGLASQTIISGFDTTYTTSGIDTAVRMAYPATLGLINGQTLIRINDAVNWLEHKLNYLGSEFKIPVDSIAISDSVTTAYIWWSPVTADQYAVTESATPPTDRHFLIATKGDLSNSTSIAWGVDSYTPVPGDFTTVQLSATDSQNLQVNLKFPAGLFDEKPSPYAEDNIRKGDARIYAQYRIIGTPTWTSFDFAGQTTAAFNGSVETDSGGLTYLRLFRQELDAFSLSLLADPVAPYLAAGQYEVRVAALAYQDITLESVSAITYGDFIYPGEALLGIRALASGQLQGDMEVTAVVERSEVLVNDGGGWVTKSANNHAWAIYDMLANGHPDHPQYPSATNTRSDVLPIYGAGIAPSGLDFPSFAAWADFIDTGLDYELNIVFDSTMTIWEAITRVALEGRGIIYPLGSKIFARADRALEANELAATLLFSQGNIHTGSFHIHWLEDWKKARLAEVDFFSAPDSYDRISFSTRTSNWDDTLEVTEPLRLTLHGTTAFDQAYGLAQFFLNCNELQRFLTYFTVDIDALGVRVGDVIRVQHDVLGAGTGGRVVSATANHIADPSFESDITGMIWTDWGSPVTKSKSSAVVEFGTFSLFLEGTTANSGALQEVPVEPDTEYTLSTWVFVLSTTSDGNGIRVQTTTSAGVQKSFADGSELSQWIRLSKTFTTGAETTLSINIGGDGIAYFDGVQLELGTASTFFTGSTVTMDRTISLVSGTRYEMVIRKQNGSMVNKDVSGNGDFATLASSSPTAFAGVRQYDPYTIGVEGAAYKLVRVIEIVRNDDLTRGVIALEYNEDVYRKATIAFAKDTGEVQPDYGQTTVLPQTNPQYQDGITAAVRTGDGILAIFIPHEVTPLTVGTDYRIWVRSAVTGNVENHRIITVESAVGLTIITTLSEPWDRFPDRGDPFSILRDTYNLDMQTQQNTGYLAKVAPIPSQPSQPIFNPATGLTLQEVIVTQGDGSVRSRIIATWNATEAQNFGEWEVFIRDVDSDDLGWAGEWASGITYTLYDKVVHAGKSYISLEDQNASRPVTL